MKLGIDATVSAVKHCLCASFSFWLFCAPILLHAQSQTETNPPVTLLTYRNAEWYGSAFWTGPDWTRVGKDWHHPGENTPSIRCFRAPRNGQVTVSGRVHKLHLDGDG